MVARGDRVESFPVERLKDVLADPKARIWIDLENAGYEGFHALEPAIHFHPLAVEDCVMDVNRPKVDDYRDHLYLAVHSARWDDNDDQPILRELDILIGERYLVTYHEEPTRGVTKAREVLERRPDLLTRGPDHLLHFILDVMVDNYLPIIETLQEQLDDLEERLFRTANQRILAEILRLKRGMSALRRIVGPQRDTILSLTREEFTGIRPETRPYLRDVYDRMTRVSDLLDSYRDELAALLEIYATQVSNRLNEVMKVLTIITVIIMPVNLIASIYGMNFVMPEQHLPPFWGYAWALSLMALVGVGTYWLLKKSKWM